jgi:hypothetical protein
LNEANISLPLSNMPEPFSGSGIFSVDLRNQIRRIPILHFSFKALILQAQSTHKISTLFPFVQVAGSIPILHFSFKALILVGAKHSQNQHSLSICASRRKHPNFAFLI